MDIDYRDFPGFKFFYLEDSFVLSITVSDCVLFYVDAVLLRGHPNYTSPKPGEFHCYSKQIITFASVKRKQWLTELMIPREDLDGSIDYGNIDSFFERDGVYLLEGEWGALSIVSDRPVIG